MPILPKSNVAGLPNPEPAPVGELKPTWAEIGHAALKETLEAKAADWAGDEFERQARRDYAARLGQPEADDLSAYDPLDNIDGYENFAKAFIPARSPQDVEAIKRSIDRNLANRQTLAEGGWRGVTAQIAAGVLDPANLIPVGGVWSKGAKAAGALRGAAEAAALAAPLLTTEELIAQRLDPSMTDEDVRQNAVMGTLFFGAFGAAHGAFRVRAPKPARAAETAVADLSAEKVASHVSEQLVAAGRPKEEAQAAAAVVAAKYRATASRFGTDAWSEFERSGLKEIAAANDAGPAAERAFAQDGPITFAQADRPTLSPADVDRALAEAGVQNVTVESDGPLGPVLDGLAGRWSDTVAALQSLGTGEARAALSHPDVPGPIDVVWAAGDHGLQYIAKAHPEVLADLPERLARMKAYQKTPNRIRLASDDARAVIRLDYDGKAKTWLLTAYEAERGGKGRRGADTTGSDPGLVDRTAKSSDQPTEGKGKPGGSFDQSPDTPRGKIEITPEGEALITLFKNADASTFMHETGHLWLFDLFRDAARSDAPDVLRADRKAVLDWFGVEHESQITVEHHEQWARGFERYLAEGKAPTPELARLFEQFKEWLLGVYRDVSKLNTPLNDDIRGVFDRMLTPEEKLKARFEEEFRAAAYPQGELVSNGSLSSAAARTTTAAQERPASAFGLEKLEARNPISDNPILRTRTSPSTETARISGQLAETPIYLAGDADGIAQPLAAETRAKAWTAPLAYALSDLDDAFLRYRTGSAPSGLSRATTRAGLGVGDLFGRNGDKLKYPQFKEEVAKAMRRGDQHAIPEVAEAAQSLRRRVFDPLKEEAVKLGLLPEGVEATGADSYLTRVYDFEKIVANRNAFIDRVLVPWLEQRFDRMERELAKSAKPEAFDRPSMSEARAIAEDITASLLGAPPGRSIFELPAGMADKMKPNLRGPLKDRTLDIPDVLIEPYLVNDVERVARVYARTMAADVELTRAFGRADMADQLQAIRDSYERLFRRTEDGKKQAELHRRMDRDLKDIAAMRDRIRGVYGIPENPHGLAVRAGRTVRALNYMRMLGGMTLSAIPDVARPVMVHGLNRVMGSGLKPLIANRRLYKLAAEETKLAGTALDLVLDNRAQQLADVWEDFGRYSKVERGIGWAQDQFGKLSMMSLWNASMKQFVGVVTQTRMLEAVEILSKGGTLPKTEARELAFMGIEADMAERIAGMATKHGERADGVWWANTDDWSDVEAARTYRAALVKQVDRIIVTPGQEKPLWMSTELGKTIGQFRSFTFSSMTKATINGLQQRDLYVLQGMLVATTLGMMSYAIKGSLSGQNLSENPLKWIEEGVNNSGALGWFFDADSIVEKASAGRLGINPVIGEQLSSKYASRSLMGDLLGPTFDLGQNAIGVTSSAVSAGLPDKDGNVQSFTRGDVHRARKLLPFQNLFYVRWLFDHFEKGAGDGLGLAERPG
jgi:hypothetical protein